MGGLLSTQETRVALELLHRAILKLKNVVPLALRTETRDTNQIRELRLRSIDRIPE